MSSASTRWCGAHVVSERPGAVGRVPAIPTIAFALFVAGGVWCALWGRRWRLPRVVPIALGPMPAPMGRRPDVLIERGAGLVAMRSADARLSAPAGAAPATSWRRLEHDGDGCSPRGSR